MTLKIAQLGQPVLRRVADLVPPETIPTPAFQEFLQQMLDTLRESGGVGLAGPQVFASRRVFLAITRPPQEGEDLPLEVFVNPRITDASDEMQSGWEGCLSFPELSVLVPRSVSIRVEYLDRQGTAHTLDLADFPARVFQHELDHLDGILTIDRALSTRDIIKASELDTVLRAGEVETE